MSVPGAGRPLEETLSLFADRVLCTEGREGAAAELPLPEERLSVYRDLVAGNARSMLRFAYTATFRVAVREAKRTGGEGGFPKSVRDIVSGFLADAPPSTHSTREMADRFRPHFERRFPTLFARWPQLSDLMTLERARLGADYALDDPGRAPDEGELDALAAAPLGEFLSRRVVRASSAALLRLQHPAATLRERVMHRDFPDPPELTGAELVCVARRPGDLEPLVRIVDEPTFLVAECAAPRADTTVEELAGRWLPAAAAVTGAASEEETVAAFVRGAFALLQYGALRFA